MTDSGREITRILQNFEQGEGAADDLLNLVYDQLRRIAAARMQDEDAGHSLAATALVHEAFIKVLDGREEGFEDRGHFFRAAAEAMRRILIDHARKKKSNKRGGHRRRVPISVLDLATDYDAESVLALNDALEVLREEDAQAWEVVHLRFFAGLDVAETADCVGISERSVAREWAFARARLFALIAEVEA